MSALKRVRSGGPDLLRFRANGSWRDVRSSDVNDYIRESVGEDFSAKDFRTWHATVLAALSLAVYGQNARSKTARKRIVSLAVKDVAHYLGNTPAVCRSSYIDPRIVDRFNEGITVQPALEALDYDATEPAAREKIESAVGTILDPQRT